MPSELRLRQVRSTFDHLPAWRVSSGKGQFYICGKCFGQMGDRPATNTAEMWMAGAPGGTVVPAKARCERCNGPAWPAD